jgi:surface antigen
MSKLAIGALGAVILLPAAGVIGIMGLTMTLGASAATGNRCSVTVSAAATTELRPEQVASATTIIRVGREIGVNDRGITIALMTGLQESGLRNYANSTVPDSLQYPHDAVGNDHDSVNAFQQRPAAGWGTVAELMNPEYAARAFYGGPTGPNGGNPRGLLDIPGWESLSLGEAAQRVQVSAFPDAYNKHEPTAVRILQQLGGGMKCTPGTSKAAGDDYPWPAETIDDEGGGFSPLRYNYRECVDFVAWRLNRDAGSTAAPFKWTWANLTPEGGNAIDWPESWRAAGWGVSNSPQAGGVAWWGSSVGSAGHVAYVQAVTPDGQVVIEEYNWGRTHRYNTRTIPASDVELFLAPPP